MRLPCCTTSRRWTPSGIGVDELIEQVHDLGTRALELRDDSHACDQTIALTLEPGDLFYLLVELGDLTA